MLTKRCSLQSRQFLRFYNKNPIIHQFKVLPLRYVGLLVLLLLVPDVRFLLPGHTVSVSLTTHYGISVQTRIWRYVNLLIEYKPAAPVSHRCVLKKNCCSTKGPHMSYYCDFASYTRTLKLYEEFNMLS
jgi:hypothetical protein